MTVTASRGKLKMIHDDVEYYEHQVTGVRTLCRMGNAILADEMGLGKSLQALTVYAVDCQMGKADRLLIVSPATLKWNWEDEIEKHTDFDWHVLYGDADQRAKQLKMFANSDIEILIVNYEQVVTHGSELNAMGFFTNVIYDEAHYIKGYNSQRTKACHKLTGKRHMLLTGSPLLNHVDDLWGLLHRVSPYEFPKYWNFRTRYCLFGGFKGKEIIGVKNETELQEILDKYMLRRLKKDVLDLPEKQHIPVWVDLNPNQRQLYDQAKKELKIDLPTDPDPMELENALVKMLRLKQICGTTATIPGYPDQSNKLDRVVEMVQDVIDSGEPVVVFTQFREVQRCLNTRFTAAGVGWRQINGDTPQQDRAPLVKAWAQDAAAGEYQALLCMIQVGGVGLNMTAAKKCIFVDKLFVPKLNEQAEDRLHRIGSDLTQPVQIFEMQTVRTIEQRVETILKRKNKVFGTLVEGDSRWKRKLYTALRETEDEDD